MKYNKELGKVKNYVNRIKMGILEEARTMDEQVKKEILKEVPDKFNEEIVKDLKSNLRSFKIWDLILTT